MKALPLVLSTFGFLGLFSLGLVLQSNAESAKPSGRIHLNCWDESGTSNIQRIRFTLDQNLQGQAWTSGFDGAPQEEGNVVRTPSPDIRHHFSVNIVTPQQSWLVEIPSYLFGTPLRSLKLSFSQGDTKTELECRKIDLTGE